MNDEIMRLFLYLLTSDDIKKQGERIINESKNSSIAENLANILFARLQEIGENAFVKIQDFMDKELQASKDLSASILEINKKIDTIYKPGEVLNLVNRVDELEKTIPIQRKKNS